jgi:hypothetical protein
MRFLSFLFLLVFVAAIAAFAYFNQDPTSIRFMDWSVTTSKAVAAGATYLLGMFTGWSVVGVIRRSASRVIQRSESRSS